MTIGEYLFFKDENNQISQKALNLLAGRICEKCSGKRHPKCRNRSESDSCWEFTEEIESF